MKESAIQAMKDYFGTDNRRINHALKVLQHAEDIADNEGIQDEATRKIITYLAIFHDIGIHEAERKHGSISGRYQEMEGPPIAEDILNKLDVDQAVIERVSYIIGHHHTFNKIDGIDFQILWEADLLVNLEEKDLYHDPIHFPDMDKTFTTNAGKEKLKTLFGIK